MQDAKSRLRSPSFRHQCQSQNNSVPRDNCKPKPSLARMHCNFPSPSSRSGSPAWTADSRTHRRHWWTGREKNRRNRVSLSFLFHLRMPSFFVPDLGWILERLVEELLSLSTEKNEKKKKKKRAPTVRFVRD